MRLSCYYQEFRHNIVKIVCGSTRRQPSGSTDFFHNVMTKFIVFKEFLQNVSLLPNFLALLVTSLAYFLLIM